MKIMVRKEISKNKYTHKMTDQHGSYCKHFYLNNITYSKSIIQIIFF